MLSIGKNENQVFVSGLPTNVTVEEMSLFFGAIGVIKTDKKSGAGGKKIFIYKDQDGLPTGRASVTYQDPQVAQSAVRQLDHNIFNGSTIEVSMAVVDSVLERRLQKQSVEYLIKWKVTDYLYLLE